MIERGKGLHTMLAAPKNEEIWPQAPYRSPFGKGERAYQAWRTACRGRQCKRREL